MGGKPGRNLVVGNEMPQISLQLEAGENQWCWRDEERRGRQAS